MKKLLTVLTIALMAAMISSCDKIQIPLNGDETVSQKETQINSTAPDAQPEIPLANTEDEAKPEAPAVPSDDEIIAEFETALNIYKSFHGRAYGASCDYNNSIKSDGMTYYKTSVDWADGINSKEELIAFMQTIFTDEIIDEMIYIENYGGKDKFPYIADSDNGLYTIICEFAMGDDMEYAGVEKREVIKESDTKLVLRITAKYYPEDWLFDDSVPENEIEYTYISFDYPMEYMDNEWKFTDFKSYN